MTGTLGLSADRFTMIEGDARRRLRELPDASVDCVITSPPYWGLRDYGHPKQLGLEETLGLYLRRMVALFAEVRRVLTKRGTLWLNIGDSYVAGRNGGIGASSLTSSRNHIAARDAWVAKGGGTHRKVPGLKGKNLIGVPWRLAFALQDDGWILRSEIIWHKPAPLPESVSDRPTKAHEHLFLLSKSRRYHYDADAISEPVTGEAHDRGKVALPKNGKADPRIERANASFHAAISGVVERRNKRSVWTIAPQPCKEAHTSTFPEALCEPCVLAGCPLDGLVLDPFAGTGTAGVVALRHGRRFVGIELRSDNCAIARRDLVVALERRGEAKAEHAAEVKGRPIQLGLLAGHS